MLAIARRKLDAVGLSERELSVVPGDILTLNLRRRFDWVCIFFNTFLGFTTLEDQDRAAHSRQTPPEARRPALARHLQPRPGLLAQDVITGLDPCVFYVPRYDRTVFMTTEVRRDKRPQVQRITFRYRWFDRHGVEQRPAGRIRTDLPLPPRTAAAAGAQRPANRHLWGNYDGSDVTPLAKADRPVLPLVTEGLAGRKCGVTEKPGIR